jgi:hypothetical protein
VIKTSSNWSETAVVYTYPGVCGDSPKPVRLEIKSR